MRHDWTLERLAGLSCRVVSERLGDGPPAEQVAGPVVLTGRWADGASIVTGAPLLVSAAPQAALRVAPRLAGADEDVVGGGWFGWIAYDGAGRLSFHDHLLRRRPDGWYFEALWSDDRDTELRTARDQALSRLQAPPGGAWSVGAPTGADAATHLAAVEEAIAAIRAGEIYQVNICTRLAAPFTGSTAAAFRQAVERLRPSYAAYVDGGDGVALLSLSPELFLRRRGRDVRTAPIKGTALDPDALRASAKDAAENVMIVDLMRNDLGRVSETGSVRVDALLDVEQHPGVWHLVSRVSGRLRADLDDAALLAATFPPGSVTGAPKVRAMEIIAALEPTTRGAYTGAVGFASPSWGSEFSVAIRTFEVGSDQIELGVGGGITADSVPMLEWRECLDKAAPLLAGIGADFARPRRPEATPAEREGGLLETLLAVDGRVVRAADHLARLDRSGRELYRRGHPADLADRVAAIVHGTTGRVAVRVLLAPDGTAGVTAAPLGDRLVAFSARVVPRPPGLWRHKWADRSWAIAAESATAESAAADSAAAGAAPLFVAEDGCVLETSRGNVFLLRDDGTLVTPPLRDDVLPGVTRRALLDLARDDGRAVELRPFGLGELREHAAFWTSSLSLAVSIHDVDGTALPQRPDEVSELARRLATNRFVS